MLWAESTNIALVPLWLHILPWLTTLIIVEWAIRLLMVIVILRRRVLPVTALAWLALIFLTPEIGLILYFLLGSNHLGRRRVKQHKAVIAALRSERIAGQEGFIARPAIEPAQLPVVLQAERIGGMPILAGNDVEFLDDSDAVVDRLIADIDAARHHVHLLFYILANDETMRRVAESLQRAVQRGVCCRVLGDAAGSFPFFGRHGLAGPLRQAGVQVHPMLPVNPLRRRLARIDLRNHRKLAVIDGSIAYAGSQNIVDAAFGHRGLRWIDMTGRFTGPIVAQLQIVFLEDWEFETDEDLDGADILPSLTPTGDMAAQTVPTGPSHETEALPRVLLTAINAARRKIIITSPYLVPDEPTILALAMAADRGVEVDLVVPHRADHPLVAAAGRAYFEYLIESGINIYLHNRGILHAKTMTVDDSFALLGSSNLDIRSFYLNFELNVLLYGAQITNELRFAQMRYISESERVDGDVWAKRPVVPRYLDSAAALLSPIL